MRTFITNEKNHDKKIFKQEAFGYTLFSEKKLKNGKTLVNMRRVKSKRAQKMTETLEKFYKKAGKDCFFFGLIWILIGAALIALALFFDKIIPAGLIPEEFDGLVHTLLPVLYVIAVIFALIGLKDFYRFFVAINNVKAYRSRILNEGRIISGAEMTYPKNDYIDHSGEHYHAIKDNHVGKTK